MQKAILQYLLILLVFNGYVFVNGYVFNFKLPVPQWLVLSLATVSSVVPWLINELKAKKKSTNIVKKGVFIVISVLLMHITVFASAFSTMYVPGSRQHDYVMYEICFPAITQRYDSLSPEQRPNYFDIHSKCEQNVWAGREPLYGFE